MYDGLPNMSDEEISNQVSTDIWNDIEIVLKPDTPDGLVFYIGPDVNPHYGMSNINDLSKALLSVYSLSGQDSPDFLAIYLSRGRITFEFNAGDGVTTVTSKHQLHMDKWQVVKVSRTGLLAEIQVDNRPRVSIIGQGAFTQVDLQMPPKNSPCKYHPFGLELFRFPFRKGTSTLAACQTLTTQVLISTWINPSADVSKR